MQLKQPASEDSHLLLRALKAVVSSQASLALIQAAQRTWLQTEFNWQKLEPIVAEELAAQLLDPDLRLGLIQAMILLVIVDDQPNWLIYQRVRQYCRALQIPTSVLRPLWLWCCQVPAVLALGVYWRCFIAEKYRFELRRRGWGWFWRGTLHYLGLGSDARLTQRYHRLRALPQDSLGYQFWQFCQQHHYRFPGEKGGIHEGLSFHDMTHVLGGFNTDAVGELQAVAMTVGYKESGDPLASLLFILMQQHLGIQVGLLSRSRRHVLDQPQVAEKMIQAWLMGCQMRVDLAEDWDPWPVMDQPVEHLRQRYGIAGDNCNRLSNWHISGIRHGGGAIG